MLAGGKLPIIYLMLSGSLLSSSICTMQCRYSVWVESVATFRHCNAVMRYALQQLQSPLELQTEVHEDFTITEKAPTRAFSWLKAPTIAFTFETLLRHFAKQD